MHRMFRAMALVLAWAISSTAFAGEFGTSDEAVAIVKKAVAFMKSNGKDKTLAEVGNKSGAFIDRDLYLSVYDLKGVVLAHGVNPKLVGKDVSSLKDADDKEFMKDILNKAKANGKGVSDYKWPNPVTQKIQAKSAYFEKVDDIILSCGYYKQ